MAEENRRKLVKIRWEKLDTDILVRIFKNCFSRHELMNSGVAHVCGGWREACCDPILWNTLDLSHMKSDFTQIPIYVFVEPHSDQEVTRFLKLAMSLSKGNTSTLIFHFNLFLNDDMLALIVQRCPNLRRLVLPAWNRLTKEFLFNAIQFCENLESLTVSSVKHPEFVFSSIAMHCKNFRELKVMGPIEVDFVEYLVKFLRNLKVLSLRCTAINLDALIKILDDMKSLEVLNISHSYLVVTRKKTVIVRDLYESIVEASKPKQFVIVRELDETIMEKASKLKQFVTCMEHKTCVMCQRTHEDEGIMKWNKYEEGLWKADEVTSLHL
ncbi:unnamed protein product [Microthlaspi erraticum]|uniref:F-box domain-containing protein n=1 Tax=Microthlaspi erraticum TaxID=1685480 RepID=A0A6D2I9Z1_9BRAS|nr:unnamed protein product [Microthlaspi erraticum]